MRLFQTRVVQKIKTRTVGSIFVSQKSCVYEIMWKNDFRLQRPLCIYYQPGICYYPITQLYGSCVFGF